MTSSSTAVLDRLLSRCTFPRSGTPAIAGCSGGADSTALLALAVRAEIEVTAVHVHHGLRETADDDALIAREVAGRLGVPFRLERVDLDDGGNLEARARRERHRRLGPHAMTGHTADDQAETVLLALLRGAGATGLAGMRPGPRHPILELRRTDTVEVCDVLGLPVATDPSNDSPRHRRNRVRHELMPLLDDIAERDVSPLMQRTATLLRDDDDLLETLAGDIDPTDVVALRSAPLPLARRALRQWLTVDGYPPDAAAIERVLAVAGNETIACEVTGVGRISRHAGRLHRPDR